MADLFVHRGRHVLFYDLSTSESLEERVYTSFYRNLTLLDSPCDRDLQLENNQAFIFVLPKPSDPLTFPVRLTAFKGAWGYLGRPILSMLLI